MQVEEELDADVLEIVEDVTREAVQLFQRSIERNRLILTDALRQDFQYHIIRSAGVLAAEMNFRAYGRFKDMEVLRYTAHHPPVDAMEFFVSKIGVDKFPYVPGYEKGQVPVNSIAVKRIAAGIAFRIRRVPDVRRKYRGTWYNETKSAMLKRAQKRIAWRMSELISAHLVKQLEGNV